MFDANVLVWITGELALLLLVICVFLLLHIGNLRKLIRKLEEKILSLRDTVGKSRKEAKKALKKLAEKDKIKPRDFLVYLDEEIESTKAFHASLNPDRDIVLDITPDAPLDRQASALRHAFLIAEKEARYAGEGESSSWDVLQGKFQQIIQFYESLAPAAKPEQPAEPEDVEEEEAADELDAEPVDIEDEGDAHAEEIATYKKRIENLERFKKLFFDMEKQWEQAKAQADEYHQQLLAMGKDLGAGEDFEEVLDKYSKSFDEIEEMINQGTDSKEPAKPQGDSGEKDSTPKSVGQVVIANQEEIQRLRNMAVDQHKVINELKRKLYEAKSAEDKERIIDDLTTQLEKQERFMKEAETCTKLIEDELSRVIKENVELQSQLKETKGELANQTSQEEIEKMEEVIKNFTAESKEMLGTIASLEKENQSLLDQLAAGTGGGESSGDGANDEMVANLQEKLTDLQQELLNLQTQHIELEERYLELKMK